MSRYGPIFAKSRKAKCSSLPTDLGESPFKNGCVNPKIEILASVLCIKHNELFDVFNDCRL